MRLFIGPDDEDDGEGVASEANLTVPIGPDALAPHYDLTISRPTAGLPQYAAFDRWLAGACQRLGLSCALLHDGVVAEVLARLADGRLTIGYHLDYYALWHVPDDPYARLSAAVEDAGGRPVNPPARARLFTDKAAAHAELARCGLGTPATVIVRPWHAERPLTAAERRRLGLDEPGARAFVKPANGYGGRGVVRADAPDPERLAAALAAARRHDPADSYLIQRGVTPPSLPCADGGHRPAYWRVYWCHGELVPFWWQPQDRVGPAPSFHPLTGDDVRRLGLRPVLAYARELAGLTGLDWFSTELCLGDGPEESRHAVQAAGRTWPVLAVDSVNDQCDLEVQSRWPGALPDAAVRRFAERFARVAWVGRAGLRRVAA